VVTVPAGGPARSRRAAIPRSLCHRRQQPPRL
jgi:hypothetical protein